MVRPKGSHIWVSRLFGLGLLLAIESRVLALEVATGVSSVDEGDDRLRPAFVVHAGNGTNFYARYFLYGRKFSTVVERTQMGSLNYAWPLFSGTWRAGLGLAQLSESITIKAIDDSDEPLSETNYNTGMSFGLFWIPNIKPTHVSIGWESHLFLAGQAGLFLSTGRKESFSFVVGLAI